jgi:hypothetical protein
MQTECSAPQLEFHGLERRAVIGKFDGGQISSDGGGVLLREVEQRTRILKRLSQCFVDHRDPELIEHDVDSLVKQRVYGIALGYEDLNDHDRLRQDHLLALLCDKKDPTGSTRHRESDKGKALAGKSTLNRLELAPRDADKKSRYKKIVADTAAMDDLLIDVFLQAHQTPPTEIILDVDATDDPLHGHQEGRFFHGYYGHYCYLPLYIFCGEHLLCARLRTADQDGAAGTVDELERIVRRIRQSWPTVRLIVRGDSGFCREHIMSWCEAHHVDYVLGLAKNNRLKAAIAVELASAKARFEHTGQAARVFKDFRYQTCKSWSCERRVVGKAEHLSKGENPRFIVTTLSHRQWQADALYEGLYCARGDMENRIKEQQLALFADRTSTHEMHSNQLRLYFSSFAYVLMQALRRMGLHDTELEKAQCDTIRLKLFKIGTQIRLSVRKVWLSLSESYPYARLFEQVLLRLQKIPIRC